MKKWILMLGMLVGASAYAANGTVTLKTIPSSPIVITGDAEIGNSTIHAPWFNFQVSIDNNTDEPLTITSVVATISGADQNGNVVTKTVSFAPGILNYDEGNVHCIYDFNYKVIAPGESQVLTAITDQAECMSPVRQSFVVDDNPTGTTQYIVTVKPEGWFGTVDQAKERFDQSITIKTR
jgi:hypothetical protein